MPSKPGSDEAFHDLIERCNALVRVNGEKIALQRELERVFLLQWTDLADVPSHFKPTRDVGPHETIEYAVDVLASADPIFKIEVPIGTVDVASAPALESGSDLLQPQDDNAIREDSDLDDLLRGFAKTALAHNKQRRRVSFIRDLLRSGFLYGEQACSVMDLRLSKHWDPESNLSLYGKSPFSFQALNATTFFDEWDDFGLSFFLRRYRRKRRDLFEAFPNKKTEIEELQNEVNGDLLYAEAWSRTECYKWIEKPLPEDADEPDPSEEITSSRLLEYKKNKLGFIPYVVRAPGGTSLFNKRRDQIFPLLFAGHQSKLFMRVNLFLTVVATLAFAEANPQMTYETATGEKTLTLDLGDTHIYPISGGEKLTPIQFGMNQLVNDVLELLMAKSEEATLPKVLGGQGVKGGGKQVAAALNMLMQGGKLKIFPVQTTTEEVLEGAVQMMFDWMKVYARESGDDELKVIIGRKEHTLTIDQIPKWCNVSCQLRGELASDRIANVQAAVTAMGKQLISEETGREWINVDHLTEEQRMKEQQAKQIQVMLAAEQARQGASAPKQLPPGEAQPTQAAEIGAPPSPQEGMQPGVVSGAVDQNPQAPNADAAMVADALKRAVTRPGG